MERTSEITKFVEYDNKKHFIIEPQRHYEFIKERLFDVINTYNPKVIVKAGVGNAKLLLDLAEHTDSYIVVVDYSLEVINSFIKENSGNKALEKIRFIAGTFNNLPVDYYAADLLISIDYFDFIDTGTAVDEFRRALQFDGILFLSMSVLADGDLDGVLDDFMAYIFPLHNDYYITNDLKTFLVLNQFKFIKGNINIAEIRLEDFLDFFSAFGESDKDSALKFIEEHQKDFNDIYAMKEGMLSVPYYIGVFKREKPQ